MYTCARCAFLTNLTLDHTYKTKFITAKLLQPFDVRIGIILPNIRHNNI